MKYYGKNIKKFITIMLLICLTITSFTNSNTTQASTNKWTIENFNLPIALKGVCVENVDGKMYIIGGNKNAKEPVNTLYIYDFESQTWSNGAALPIKVVSGQSIFNDGKIYYMGGQQESNGNWTSTNELIVYDIKTNQWSKGTAMPLATSHAKAVLYQNKIYVFGGFINLNGVITTYHKSIQIYDIDTGSWSNDESMPFTRYGHTININGDKVYLIGGHDGTNFCNNVKIYDLVSNTWSEGAKPIEVRHQANSIIHNNKIYVMGGSNSTSALLNTMNVYDTVTNSWSTMPSLNEAKRLLASTVYDNKIYSVGGEISLTTTAISNKIETYQLPPEDNRLYAHLYINEKTQLSFTHELADNQILTWKSSSPDTATVDDDGKVTAIQKGTTFISAYNQNGIFLDYIPVIVTENDLYRIAVHLNTGQKQKLYLKGNSNDITWSSMDNSIATVSSRGEVSAIGTGLAIVKAQLDGKEHYIYIRVN